MLYTEYHHGDQTKKDDIGEACITHGCDEKCIQNYNLKT
jgi:hypothetical protein